MTVSVPALKELLDRWVISPDSRCADRILCYLRLLDKWNARINLTASTEWEALKPLVEEAIWATQFYRKESSTHLDVGTGAGFPALLMSILIPDMRLEMMESRAKRAMFLETAIAELGLTHARVFNERLEEYLRRSPMQWDCVSWKAIKLGSYDLKCLARCGSVETEYWIFHGAIQAQIVEECFELRRREAFPSKPGWFLSIYVQRIPS